MRFLLILASLALSAVAAAQPAPGKRYTYGERGQVLSVVDAAHPEADTSTPTTPTAIAKRAAARENTCATEAAPL